MSRQIAIYYRNGECQERYALHIEADTEEEWRGAIKSLDYCETATLFENNQQVRTYTAIDMPR